MASRIILGWGNNYLEDIKIYRLFYYLAETGDDTHYTARADESRNCKGMSVSF